jgi:hypothetical protein
MKNIAKREKQLDVAAQRPDAGAMSSRRGARNCCAPRRQSPGIPYDARGKKHQKCLTPCPKNSINMVAF